MQEFRDDTTDGSSIDDNLLGLTTKEQINEEEAWGVARAEEYLLDLDENTVIDTYLIMEIHKVAFGHLYDWAGKFRTIEVTVGKYTPPPYNTLSQLMAGFVYELRYKLENVSTEDDLVRAIAYAHHRILWVHPFNNGNGRTARLITNLIALLHGYQGIPLYYREGAERDVYIEAVKKADEYQFERLEALIKKGLKKL